MPKRISTSEYVIGGKALAEWDQEWKSVPGGFAQPHDDLKGKAGLYRALEDGKTVVIGKSSEKTGNRLYKRLADFRRSSNSARDHHIGKYIFENRHSLKLQVLITGDDQMACQLAAALRGPMIKLHEPRENVRKRGVDQA